MASGSYSMTPGGDIRFATFVKQNPAAERQVLQCGAGDAVFGISQPSTRRIALDPYDTDLCGKAGDPAILIYGPLSPPDVLLQLGADCQPGDRLGPDANGRGVPVTADKARYGALSRVAGKAGQCIPVDVMIGEISA